MKPLVHGRFRAELADSRAAREDALALRARVFRGGAPDGDAYDALCDHIVVYDGDNLVGCVRILPAHDVLASYSAQFYDLTRLTSARLPMAEVGRFCIRSTLVDLDLMRVMWGALTRYVDETGVKMLFGCASFPGGVDAGRDGALAYLKAHHLAPAELMPQRKSPHVIEIPDGPVDPVVALKAMPALLRSYLAMGAWVSDHAVVDSDLDTVHIFTGLMLDTIPEARKRQLRAIAGS